MHEDKPEAELAQIRAGRPKSEAKGAAILAAATELFLARGFQATSMDAVAKDAGVSKQTVYGHFANKDELFKSCIRNKVGSYHIGEIAIPGNANLRAGLFDIVRNFLALLTDPEVVAMHRVIMSEAASQPRVAELFYESGPLAAKNAVVDFLCHQAEAGRLRIPPERFMYAAVQLLSMAQGTYQLQLLLGMLNDIPETDLSGHLDQVVDDFLVLYGV